MSTALDSVLDLQTPSAGLEAHRASIRSNFSPSRRPSNRETSIAPLPSVITGTLIGFNSSKAPLVDFPHNESGMALPARSMIALNERDAGCEIALMFENGAAAKPVILGRLQPQDAKESEDSVNVSLDGEQVTLSAKNEIVLRCGKASITLTRAGKVLINGEYLLSRSAGVNRIKGGSVQIN